MTAIFRAIFIGQLQCWYCLATGILIYFATIRTACGFSSVTPPTPFWFSPPTIPSPPIASPSCVVFLHGRLESDPGEPPFPPPNVLYRQFCSSIVASLDMPVLQIDYHKILSKKLGKERRTWQMGPISQAIADSITKELHNKETSIILITFSMGAAMGMKLLQNAETLFSHQNLTITRLVLIEPVWRCWLSLVPHDKPISDVPALAVFGSLDKDTLTDSGKNVHGSLRPLLSNLTTVRLHGGNHWYILNSDLPVSWNGIREDERAKTPGELRDELINDILLKFCQNSIKNDR